MIKPKAAVLLPEAEKQNPELILQCLTYISVHGYVFDSIVSDWDQLMRMRQEGIIQVVVYARPEHIYLAGLPRFELATENDQPAPAPAPPTPPRGRSRDRRPNIVG